MKKKLYFLFLDFSIFCFLFIRKSELLPRHQRRVVRFSLDLSYCNYWYWYWPTSFGMVGGVCSLTSMIYKWFDVYHSKNFLFFSLMLIFSSLYFFVFALLLFCINKTTYKVRWKVNFASLCGVTFKQLGSRLLFMRLGLFQLPPLDDAVAPCPGAAKKVEVQHLLHCLSKGTGSGSAARFSVIPSLRGSLAQSSAMATAESLLPDTSSA